MQLSILMPTHRRDLLALARIAQACSWASPQIEVVIRDNSGDAQKQGLLTQFQREHCRIISVDPCDPTTNFAELLRIAKGDFVYIVADDDFSFDRAIAALPGIIDQFGNDPSVIGVAGAYLIEAANGSSVSAYEGVGSDDARTRLAGYLKYPGPNVLLYSPVRRQVAQRAFALVTAMPLTFSFQDQVLCLLYLLDGKFVPLQRLLYGYETGPWENRETAQARDLDFYNANALDPAINKLHWFLCAFEGAALIANPQIVQGCSAAQRQAVADLWFSAMYARFKADSRNTFGSRFAPDAEKLAAKWLVQSGQLSFQNMLTDIRDFIGLFSKESGQKYFDFWNAVVNRRNPLAQEAAAASG